MALGMCNIKLGDTPEKEHTCIVTNIDIHLHACIQYSRVQTLMHALFTFICVQQSFSDCFIQHMHMSLCTHKHAQSHMHNLNTHTGY